jgi:glycosyltransferase involved in cell wall biosynthesis
LRKRKKWKVQNSFNKIETMQISVVIPLYNEEESLPELHAWIGKVMEKNNFSFEIVFIDDGSNDKSWEVVENLANNDNHVKGIKFRRNYGKSAALNTAFEVVKGDVVITMDADLQDSPEEIPELYRMIVEDNYDVVSGWKKKRYDPITKTIPTKIYNFATRKMTKVKLHDMNCGLKSYKNEVVKSIEVYGEMHRYIPAIANWAGFKRIGEKVVQHQARKYGKSKFGMSRFVNGFLDLLTITFLSRYGKKPMHFFGLWGTLIFIAGFGIAIYLSIAKVFYEVYHITERPLFYLAILFMIVGSQLFLSGFVAEMVSRNASERNTYLIHKRLGLEEGDE